MIPLRDSARYVKRTVRALRGQDLWQPAQVQCPRTYLGNEGARWCLCPSDLSSASVVYSFGIGEDVSFDLAVIARFGAQVHAFDPTPRSLEWLRRQSLPQQLVVHEYGIADYDGNSRFFPPSNLSYVSHSVLPREIPGPVIEVPVHRLTTIMKKLGHPTIDVLKMDIEGAEYAVLRDLLSCRIRVNQLLVEFHHRWPAVGIEPTRDAVRDLNRAGYWIFNVSPSGEEYSFKRRGVARSGRKPALDRVLPRK